MKKILLLLCALLGTVGAMAQTDAEYEAALAAIGDNGVYYVKTDVSGTYYYLKGDGYLTATKSEATLFTFLKTPGNFKPFGYQLNNNGSYFRQVLKINHQ